LLCVCALSLPLPFPFPCPSSRNPIPLSCVSSPEPSKQASVSAPHDHEGHAAGQRPSPLRHQSEWIKTWKFMLWMDGYACKTLPPQPQPARRRGGGDGWAIQTPPPIDDLIDRSNTPSQRTGWRSSQQQRDSPGELADEHGGWRAVVVCVCRDESWGVRIQQMRRGEPTNSSSSSSRGSLALIISSSSSALAHINPYDERQTKPAHNPL
jgi:hypothetical protein